LAGFNFFRVGAIVMRRIPHSVYRVLTFTAYQML